jgi:exosortase/archaeosortase family protein
VDVIASGNNLISADGSWGQFNVAEGCSGIRSLMAMGLVAAIYAHVTETVLWKQILIFVLALPLAIVANMLRVASVVLIAKYVNPDFAANLYHDWSSFLFFPFALLGLILVGQLLNFSRHFRHRVIVIGEESTKEATS